jgi:hypothetical protein
MKESDFPSNFGLAIAFLAPGVVGLWGVAQHVPEVKHWFGTSQSSQPSGASFLFVALASLAVGVVISGIRQLVLDTWAFRNGCWPLFKYGGIPNWIGFRISLKGPTLHHEKLIQDGVRQAYNRVVEGNYRYYQFYSNMGFAAMLAYGVWTWTRGLWPWERPSIAGLALALFTFLILSARQSLSMFNRSIGEILGEGEESDGK